MKILFMLLFFLMFSGCNASREEASGTQISYLNNKIIEQGVEIETLNETIVMLKYEISEKNEIISRLNQEINVLRNPVLSFQNEMDLWISQNNIQVENQIINHNGIKLYRRPHLQENFPPWTELGIGMFAIGRFLTISEMEIMHEAVYNSIPQNIKEERYPFRTFERFKNSLIFNPSVLFNERSRSFLNSHFNEDYAYLIFYFRPTSGTYSFTMFDTQLEQLTEGISRNFLILPGSLHYAVFRINNDGSIEFIIHLGIG